MVLYGIFFALLLGASACGWLLPDINIGPAEKTATVELIEISPIATATPLPTVTPRPTFTATAIPPAVVTMTPTPTPGVFNSPISPLATAEPEASIYSAYYLGVRDLCLYTHYLEGKAYEAAISPCLNLVQIAQDAGWETIEALPERETY